MRRSLIDLWGAGRAVVWLAAMLSAGSAAHAAAPRPYGSATVRSVDGPGELTIVAARKAIRVRLSFVDLPRTGECGAVEATTALRGFVSRAPRKFDYEIDQLAAGRLARDTDGRYLIELAYRSGMRNLATDLIAADWGRPGQPATLDNPISTHQWDGGDPDWAGRSLLDRPRVRRGVWATCGGLVHLPLGAAAPANAPTTWNVDEHGVTTAVGSTALPATLTPTGALTLRQLVGTAPAEATRWYGGCRVWVPSRQLRAWVSSPSKPCGDAYVASIRTSGPDPAPLTRGVAVGDPAMAFAERFPLMGMKTPSLGDWNLSGPDHHQWAWQTDATVGEAGRITALATFAAPLLPTG